MVPIHVGGGYGGDSDWIHGMWKGGSFTERFTYDRTDPAIIGRAGFGVIDHVGRAVCRDADGTEREGWGLFEHGALGRHDPSGFADWLTVGPPDLPPKWHSGRRALALSLLECRFGGTWG